MHIDAHTNMIHSYLIFAFEANAEPLQSCLSRKHGLGLHSVSVWSTEFYGSMNALQLKAADPRPQKAKAQPFEHQVVCPACHYPFPGSEDLGGAAVHHATQGEDDGVEGEVAVRAVPDLVVSNRVEVLVDQPGWVGVLIREQSPPAEDLSPETPAMRN
jgi:hypothetical protein